MTLRDLGEWIGNRWQAILDALQIAATQSFWDWPLWMSISVGIGLPLLLLCFIGKLAQEMREGEPEPLGWTIAFGVATLLSALVTYDLFVSLTIFEEGKDDWLKIGYPIMTAFFGSFFAVEVAKRRRASGKQSDDQK